jgi:transcriptional regulator with XRE-family HTH domain
MALRRGSGRVSPEDRDVDRPAGLPQEIVDEITWYMREHKITRSELASSLGVSPGRVSQILSGEDNLTLRTLGGVVDALGARLEVTIQPVEEPKELFDELV